MSERLDSFLGLRSNVTREELIAWINQESNNRTRTIIYYNNRSVGTIYHHPVFGKIFVTYRKKSEHVYEKWKSIGISRDIIIKLIRMSVNKIVILFTDTKEVYMCSPRKFLEEGKALWFKDESDSQLHLCIDELCRI